MLELLTLLCRCFLCRLRATHIRAESSISRGTVPITMIENLGRCEYETFDGKMSYGGERGDRRGGEASATGDAKTMEVR